MSEPSCDVVVIGAGPYGLAAAAHLKAAGVEPRVFGEPMAFWKHQMPSGMLLRSSWYASHISDPRGVYTLDAYASAQAVKVPSPVPLDDFVRYGRWFQSRAVPEVDSRLVSKVETTDGGFSVQLEGGELLRARRVVVAGGIAPFARRLPLFNGLPRTLASHSSEHRDLGQFAGRRVIVVGGGQSALESGALLAECGAEVEVLVRRPHLTWLHRRKGLNRQLGLMRFLDPPTDVGPLGLSWLVALPDVFRRLPRAAQDRIAYRCIRPAGANWLQPRMRDVRVTTGRKVETVALAGTRAKLTLDDGSERLADHVLLATGYQIDVTRYPFLGTRLARMVRSVGGYPELSDGFESSVPGLHFVGAPAARSFGPLVRFVVGTIYSSRSLARRLQKS